MTPQYDNQVISSALAFFDHWICTRGTAFTNTSSLFYPSDTNFGGYYSYACPFTQLISDVSVTGANIMSGVYLNGNFIRPGQSGLHEIDFNQGRVYFSGAITGSNRISGNYAVKDFNIRLTDQSDTKLLFETRYSLRAKTPQTPTGRYSDETSYPIIFLKANGGENTPFAFGGMDLSCMGMRAIVLSDSQFKLDACLSILKDSARKSIPLITESEMPLNAFGGYRSGVLYHYNNLVSGKNPGDIVSIDTVQSSKFNQNLYAEVVKNLNPEIFAGIADIELLKPRFPRV